MIPKLTIGRLALENNLVLAPMAGITDLPVRLLAREQGASLCFTEMVSVNGLVRDGRKTLELIRSSAEDRPLGIQIFGEDPETAAAGAAVVAGSADLIDINMGCPVKKVVSSGAGAALLRDPLRVAAIIRAVRERVAVPLTVKIRTGWQAGEENFLEIGRIAEEEGCDAVTLHPRTRAQMFTGAAEWARIAELKSRLRIPVLGSGDIFTPQDALWMLQKTGCDGVMIARGGMGNPWLFRDILSLMKGEEPLPPTREERLAVSLRHLEFLAPAGEKVAVREMRKHVSWYTRGIPGAARFRAEVNSIEELETLVRELRTFFLGENG
jgi:tRNA-dihydrouridine synthase B